MVTLDWEDWPEMEKAGAVFLPAAGERFGNEVSLAYNYYPRGGYWTSDVGENEWASSCAKSLLMQIDNGWWQVELWKSGTFRRTGLSVRLVGPGAYNQ